jgi:hypothetical protein
MFDALTSTQEDLVAGLQDAFTFSHTDIDTDSPVNAPVLTNGTYTAVVWSLSAVHSGTFVGLEATGQAVEIEGVTLIQVPQNDGDEPQFMRFIDWSEVFGQLGVATTGRPVVALD